MCGYILKDANFNVLHDSAHLLRSEIDDMCYKDIEDLPFFNSIPLS